MALPQRLIETDIDEIFREANALRPSEKTAMFRVALEVLFSPEIQNAGHRIKMLRVLQAILAGLPHSSLPEQESWATMGYLDQYIATVSQYGEDPEEYRAIVDVLALLFLKAKDKSGTLKKKIYKEFIRASTDRDPEVQAFAAEALSARGLLARGSAKKPHSRLSEQGGMPTATSAATVKS